MYISIRRYDYDLISAVPYDNALAISREEAVQQAVALTAAKSLEKENAEGKQEREMHMENKESTTSSSSASSSRASGGHSLSNKQSNGPAGARHLRFVRQAEMNGSVKNNSNDNHNRAILIAGPAEIYRPQSLVRPKTTDLSIDGAYAR